MHLAYAKLECPLPTSITLLSHHPVDSYNESITHLKAIAELVGIFERFVHLIAEAEAGLYFSELELEKLLDHWDHVPAQVAQFRSRHPSFEADVGCIMFALGIRVTFYVQALPTPTKAEFKAVGYGWMYNVMIRSTFHFVNEWYKSTREYPRHQILTLVLAISCTRRVMQFYSLAGQVSPEDFDFGMVPLAEQKMYALGGGPARALNMVQHAFKDEGARHAELDRLSDQNMLSFLDTNDLSSIFNLDFSSWDSLFGGMGSTHAAAPTMEYTQHHNDFRP